MEHLTLNPTTGSDTEGIRDLFVQVCEEFFQVLCCVYKKSIVPCKNQTAYDGLCKKKKEMYTSLMLGSNSVHTTQSLKEFLTHLNKKISCLGCQLPSVSAKVRRPFHWCDEM